MSNNRTGAEGIDAEECGDEVGGAPASEELIDAAIPRLAQKVLIQRMARHAGLYPHHTHKMLAERYRVSVETVRRWCARSDFQRIAVETARASDGDILQASVDFLRSRQLDYAHRLDELIMQNVDHRAAIAALGKALDIQGLAKSAPPAVPQTIILLQAALGNQLMAGHAAVIEGTIRTEQPADASGKADDARS